jgi:uncharacterized protein (TIGR03437 family)
MRIPFFAFFLLSTASAWAQTPVITAVVTAGPMDAFFGPGTTVYVFGTFVPQSAGRDYTITVGGQSGGINVADNGVFITANIPVTTPAGAQTMTISYQGQVSNALPITVAPLAPEFSGGSVTVSGPQKQEFHAYYPFAHTSSGSLVTPTSPASLGEVLQVTLYGIGQSVPPGVMPTVTVSGQNASVLQATSTSAGRETIYFAVPENAPLGIDPVIATVSGVASHPVSIPLGSGPAIGAVLSGASFGSSGSVAPGSIVSIFGAGFGSQDDLSVFPSTSAHGVTVLFGDTPAPIFALAATGGQINALVPTELPSSGTVNLTVQDSGGGSAVFPVNLVPAAPGIFFYTDPSRPTRKNAVAVTANTAWIAMPVSMGAAMGLPMNCTTLGAATLCAQPAHPGDYLQIYVTGMGQATPNGDAAGAVLPTGSVAPASGNPLYLTVSTPTVTIGGQPAMVLFSGLAPGYSGLYQVDVQIPAKASTGDDVPIQISMAGASDSATIALQ